MTKHLCDACSGNLDKANVLSVRNEPFEVCSPCADKLINTLRVTHAFKKGRPNGSKNKPIKEKENKREAWQTA